MVRCSHGRPFSISNDGGGEKFKIFHCRYHRTCVNADNPNVEPKWNAFFRREYCIKEIRWAQESGKHIHPIIRIEDKQRFGEFLSLLEKPLKVDGVMQNISDLKILGKTDWQSLDRNDRDFWKLGMTKVHEALKKAEEKRTRTLSGSETKSSSDRTTKPEKNKNLANDGLQGTITKTNNEGFESTGSIQEFSHFESTRFFGNLVFALCPLALFPLALFCITIEPDDLFIPDHYLHCSDGDIYEHWELFRSLQSYTDNVKPYQNAVEFQTSVIIFRLGLASNHIHDVRVSVPKPSKTSETK